MIYLYLKAFFHKLVRVFMPAPKSYEQIVGVLITMATELEDYSSARETDYRDANAKAQIAAYEADRSATVAVALRKILS